MSLIKVKSRGTDNVSGRRNLIINGAMQVAQRGTTLSSNGYLLDRFKVDAAGFSFTQTQQSLTSGSPYDEGFRHFLRAANTSVSSGTTDYMHMYHYIEAQNLAKSGWNYTSTASKITLSFWVRSSLAGTYYINLRTQHGTQQNYTSPFTLVADTWKKVSFVLPGNSNITINSDVTAGLFLGVLPHYGTHYTTSSFTNNQWGTYSNTNITPDFVQNWGNTANATFDITGIQMEVGDSASDFEHLSFGEELALCQRYYHQANFTAGPHYGGGALALYAFNATEAGGTTTFPVTMRAAPTVRIKDAAGNIGGIHRAAVGNVTSGVAIGWAGNADANAKGISQVYKTNAWATGNMLIGGYEAVAEL